MNIQENVNLAKYTSFKIGGNARYFADARSAEDIKEAIEFARKNNLPYFVLGGGTNTLVRDQGYEGLAIRNFIKELSIEDGLVVAGTGNVLPEIHNFANQNGLIGFEKLATVPGTLGGALYNNAHYMDELISQKLAWVDILDPQTGETKRIPADQLDFKYDSSKIKTDNLIALRAGLNLLKGDTAQSKKLFLDLLKKRSDSQPYGTFNSGCVFQNVQSQIGPGNHGTSAGYLIEQCGLKGTKIGDVEISRKHANFFINCGKARSEDILKLAEMCQTKVKEKFGVDLQFEIKII